VQGGSLRGRVELRQPAVTSARPNVSELGAGDRRRVPERPQAVVYLETAPRGAFEQAEPGRASMDQRNETFVPHVLAITTGTVVAFPNSDHIYHNVFSLSKTGRFDLGRYAAGKSKGVRMDRPGVVRVFCDIHSHMNAFVLVFNHPFFDVTDATAFQLPSPCGTHARRLSARARQRAIGVVPAGWPKWTWSSPNASAGSIQSHFLASALLAMLSIGAAVFVSSRMTSETEAELRATTPKRPRSSGARHAVRQRRRSAAIADLPKFKAVVVGDRPR
jgi:plastocyanin